MMEDLTLFQARKQGFLTQFLKRKFSVPLSSYISQNTLIMSHSSGVPIICILVLDFARVVIAVAFSKVEKV